MSTGREGVIQRSYNVSLCQDFYSLSNFLKILYNYKFYIYNYYKTLAIFSCLVQYILKSLSYTQYLPLLYPYIVPQLVPSGLFSISVCLLLFFCLTYIYIYIYILVT